MPTNFNQMVFVHAWQSECGWNCAVATSHFIHWCCEPTDKPGSIMIMMNKHLKDAHQEMSSIWNDFGWVVKQGIENT